MSTQVQSQPAASTPAPAAATQQADPNAGVAQAPAEGQKTDAGAPEPEKTDPRFASKFAALSREEKRVRAEKEALKAEQAKIKGEWERVQKEVEDAKTARERIAKGKQREDFLNFIQEEFGYTFKDIVDMQLSGGKIPAEIKLKALEEKFTAKEKEEKEAKERAEKEAAEKKAQAEQTEREKALSEFKGSIKAWIDTNKSDFELTAKNDPDGDLIFQLIIDDFMDEEGNPKKEKPMTPEEAAKLVEAHFEKQVEELLALQKIQKKIGKAPADPAAKDGETGKTNWKDVFKAEGEKSGSTKAAVKTLSNDLETEVPAIESDPTDWNDHGSLRKAAAMLRWTS